MGYETQIFIVEDYSFDTVRESKSQVGVKYRSHRVLASVNLSKMGGDSPVEHLRQKYAQKQEADEVHPGVYKFGHNGVGDKDWKTLQESDLWENDAWQKKLTEAFYEEHVILDDYGDRLVEIPATEFLQALKESNEAEPYRRFSMAIALIEETLKHFEPERLFVITYGY